MKILVLSDNHHKDINLNIDEFDYVIHCGDCGYSYNLLRNQNNALYVKGNCDFQGDKECSYYINNKKIFITHGDLYNVKMHYSNLLYRALEVECNYCFFGHTHRQDVFKKDNIIFINPGAYMDGYYVIIDDNYILQYKEDKIINKIKNKW